MTFSVHDNVCITWRKIVVHIDNGNISLTVACRIVTYHQMPFGIGITNDMDIFSHVKVPCNLLLYNQNIGSITNWMCLCI